MHRRSKFVALIAIAALLAAALPSGAAAGAPVSVKIALAAPLTAGAVEMGHGMERGTQLAILDYQSQLTSAGVSMTMLSADDQGDPAVAVNAANAIVADPQVIGVVGHLNSGCSIPASKVYAVAGLTMVTPVSTNPALTQQGLDNVFRTCATDAGQGGFAADTVVRNLRLGSAYVVNDWTPYGTGLSSGFAKRFKSDGGRIVGGASTSDTQTNFASLVRKIKAKKPAVVYYGGIYNAGALLAKQLKGAGVNAQFVGGDGLLDPAFVGLAGRTRAEGSLCTNVGLPLTQMPGGVAFSQRYAAAFPGQQPQLYDAYAYDAAVAIIKASLAVVADAGNAGALASPSGREAVRAKVAASDFTGVTGGIGFNSAGDTKYPTFSAWRVKSGAWRASAVVGRPSVPASTAKNAAFTVSGSLKPHHSAGSKAIVLRFWRHVGKKWVLGKSVAVRVADAGVFSAYSARVKLPVKGTWRVVATHSDGSHGSMDSISSFIRVR